MFVIILLLIIICLLGGAAMLKNAVMYSLSFIMLCIGWIAFCHWLGIPLWAATLCTMLAILAIVAALKIAIWMGLDK